MMFVFVITAIIGYLVIFNSKRNCNTDCSIIYSDFGWPILIMFGILWSLVIISSISIDINIFKNFKEFENTGLQKYHGNIEFSSKSSIMMKPCKEREAIIKNTIRLICYTLNYIFPCKQIDFFRINLCIKNQITCNSNALISFEFSVGILFLIKLNWSTYIITQLLIWCSVILNPYIYGYFNTPFREAVENIFQRN